MWIFSQPILLNLTSFVFPWLLHARIDLLLFCAFPNDSDKTRGVLKKTNLSYEIHLQNLFKFSLTSSFWNWCLKTAFSFCSLTYLQDNHQIYWLKLLRSILCWFTISKKRALLAKTIFAFKLEMQILQKWFY
jgi:hypothetical protein